MIALGKREGSIGTFAVRKVSETNVPYVRPVRWNTSSRAPASPTVSEILYNFGPANRIESGLQVA